MSIPNIYLIGPMGSGKSAVGRRLAKLLDRPFYDSDDEIESHTGVDIGFIFEKEGEDGFRERESQMIKELTQLDEIVLATGGGSIVRQENRQWLTSGGTVVYLATSVPQQLKRTSGRGNRPLLQTDDPAAVLEGLAEIRNPLYESLADITTVTDNLHVYRVAQAIMEALNKKYEDN
ncbi:MAG: shikimate kinase AroK [Pseudomonadota bacterium]